MTPCLIGIAGASCSGKTTLADALADRLRPDAAQIGLDSYYYDLSHLGETEIARYNLDEPAALEERLLIDNLERLSAGKPVEKPVYDHKTHTRRDAPELIAAARYVIIEGLLALYWEEARHLFHTKVFIEATHDICLERRFQRDRNKRGRTREEVEQRYRNTVGPMYDLHVLPTQRHADVIVSATGPLHKSVSTIITHVQR